MSMNTDYQGGRNGPLTQEIRDYLRDTKARYRWSYGYLGKMLNISGGFAHNLIAKGGNVTTDTAYIGVARGIDRLKAGETQPDGHNEQSTAAAAALDHSYHLRDGLQITFTLPTDLTEREADRLAMFIKSLAH